MTAERIAPFAHVLAAIRVLERHPEGLGLADLAAAVGVPATRLTDEIHAYYGDGVPAVAAVAGHAEPVIEFVPSTSVGDGEPDRVAVRVRLHDVRSEMEAAARLISVDELGALTRVARAQLARDGDNAELRSALSALERGVFTGFQTTDPKWLSQRCRPLRRALTERRRVLITYVGGWRPGVSTQVVEPYQLVRTRLGWELDAVVVDHGRIRTFLVSGVRSVSVLDEPFSRPADVWERLAAHRRTRGVDVVVPHGACWAVHLHAESAEVIEEDHEVVKLRIELLPPAALRLGLVLLAAGPEAFVVEPAEFDDAGRALARDLLAHHSR